MRAVEVAAALRTLRREWPSCAAFDAIARAAARAILRPAFAPKLSSCMFAATMYLAAAPAFAQDEVSFEIDDAQVSPWASFADLLLRADRVTGLPNHRQDLERFEGKLHLGTFFQGEAVSFGLAAELAQGSDDNADNLLNNDVETSDAIDLDQLWWRWRPNAHASLQAGKAPLALDLTPMLWDEDLRPIGVSGRFGRQLGEASRWQLDLGGFQPNPLGERGATLAAVQLGWHWREGAPLSAGVLLGYLEWSDLSGYARAGLGRGNRVAAGRYLEDYRLIDVQAYLRTRVMDRALQLRLDRVNNLAAASQNDGSRASLVLGNRFEGGWEFGWAWQRIQRDASLAAVNADDWWFHAATRGHMPWLGYGWDATWSLRLAAFFETRDGLSEKTQRVLLDVAARW